MLTSACCSVGKLEHGIDQDLNIFTSEWGGGQMNHAAEKLAPSPAQYPLIQKYDANWMHGWAYCHVSSPNWLASLRPRIKDLIAELLGGPDPWISALHLSARCVCLLRSAVPHFFHTYCDASFCTFFIIPLSSPSWAHTSTSMVKLWCCVWTNVLCE